MDTGDADSRMMDPERKSSLLWGVIGGLSFLVLIQGYHLVTGEFVGVWVMAGVATIVFTVSTVSTHLMRPLLARRNERP